MDRTSGNEILRRTALIAVLVVAAFAIYARFHDLGGRSLAEDEYYTVKSVQAILEHGVPDRVTGGYYLRFLPLQYVQAGSSLVFGDNEFAHRLPAAILGAAAVLIFFLYARLYLGRSYAVLGSVMFALSAWEIEFSRFSRMYTALQLLALLFFYCCHKAFVEKNDRYMYAPYAIALVAITIHKLGVFFFPFLLVPILREEQAAKPFSVNRRAAISAAIVATVSFAYTQISSAIARWNVLEPTVPEGFAGYDSSVLGRNAVFPFFSMERWAVSPVLLAFASIALLSVIALIMHRRRPANAAIWIGVAILFASAVFHMFALYGLTLAVLIFRYDLHLKALREREVAVALAITAVPAALWLIYAALNESSLMAIAPGDFPKSFRLAFLSFPDLYTPSIRVWREFVPVLAFITFPALFLQLFLIRKWEPHQAMAHPALFPALILLVFGVFNAVSLTTRYWFFAYPFLLICCAASVRYLVERIFRRSRLTPSMKGALYCSLFVGIFVASEDFQPKQILQPTDDDVAFRTGQFAPLEHHWYYRMDEKTPAQFVNNYGSSIDLVLIDGRLSAVEHYLDEDLTQAFYLSRAGFNSEKRYAYRSRKGGTEELWTGSPLLDTQDELLNFTEDKQVIMLIRRSETYHHKPDLVALFGERANAAERLHLSIDGKIEVVRIELKGDR